MVETRTLTAADARKFLKTGKTGGAAVTDLAAVCDQLVRAETQNSASKSVELGKRFVNRAESIGGTMLKTALRSCGWALLVSGNYAEARKIYLRARKMMSDDPMARARIDRVLVDVYMYLDKPGEAARRGKMALDRFGRMRAPADQAKTRVNLANVLHRQDRHVEAKKLYEKATSYFESVGEELPTALCYYNLANTLVQLFDFKRAEDLYSKGRMIFEKYDQQLHATGCLYGLAWLHMLEGKFHQALSELTTCEETYRSGKQARELVLCQLDRAESYLGLNLFVDARSAAEEGARGAERLGITYETAKAAFFRAKANVGLGNLRQARTDLKRAEGCFKQADNSGFLAAVRFTDGQIDSSSGRLDRLKSAREQFRANQLPLWEAICDLQLLTAGSNGQSILRRLSRNRAVATVPHLFAHHQTLLGDRAADIGRMSSAVKHWTKAADVLEDVRAKLPPIDLRSSFFKSHTDPHRRLMETEADRNALEAGAWCERFKTAGLWSPSNDLISANPVRQKVAENLSELASHVTAVSSSISGRGGKRSMVGFVAPEKFRKLQAEVRHGLADLERNRQNRADSFEQVRQQITRCSYRQPLVQFHVGSTDILAFVHHRGASKSFRYTGGVQLLSELVARWRFLVECAPEASRKPTRADLAEERLLLSRMGEWLLAPLEIPHNADRLLIIPEGQLTSLPWAALTHGGRPLIDDHDLIFSPSLKHHLQPGRRATRSKDVKIFVGKSDDLPQVNREISAIRARFDSSTIEVIDPCRRSDWPDNSSARVWHYSGHASLRSDNPFYSSLLLDDGPLFAADFRLKRNRVDLVTLAACRTGQQTSLPGEEASGLVRSLLEMGARNVIAGNWAVSDSSTSLWMDLIHRFYADGSSVRQALGQSARLVREKFPSAYHWSAFSAYGSG